MRALTAAAAAAFAVDQGSKLAMLHVLELPLRGEVAVLPPFLVFRMGWNRGVNFGLLAGDAEVMRWALVALALGISALVLVWARRERGRAVVQVSAGLLIGGALGNALDRVVHGAVVDFLNMSCCGIANPYVFNIADVAIFAGAIGLALFAGRGEHARRRSGRGGRDGASGGGYG
jgi:signal peptidase II